MFACLHLPDLPIEAALLENPSWRDHPCAMLADSTRPGDTGAPLCVVNHMARRHGVSPGMSSVRAQLRCPALRLLDRHPEHERQLTERLACIAESFGPDFEITTPDTLIIDLNGCPEPVHWNPPMNHLRLNLADTPDLARFAALAGLPFSPRPAQPADLDKLPISLLRDIASPTPERLLSLLSMWGLHTLGDLRHLPAPDLAERTNPETLRIHQILNGRHQRLLKLHRPRAAFVQNIHFDQSIENLEPLLFQIKTMLHTLCARIESCHLAVSSLRLKFTIETNDSIERLIQLPEPRMAPERLLPVIHAALENLRLGAGVRALELELEPVKPVAAQREWLGRQLRQPGRWPDTLARLEGLLGHGRVGIAQPRPGHRPDDFEVHPPSGSLEAACDRRPDCGFPLRRFRPPLEVAVAATGDGLEQRPQALLTGPFAGRVRRCHGPFPMSGDWWCLQGAWRRIEWDVEMESLHLLRLASLPPDRWLVEGTY